jgi:hypothetical protein
MFILENINHITFFKFLPNGEKTLVDNYLVKQLETIKKWNTTHVEFFQTQIPHLIGKISVPLNEWSNYKSFISELLEKGIADLIEMEEYPEKQFSSFPKMTITGKEIWIYCHQKICQFDSLISLYKEEKSQGEVSIIYEFVNQAEKLFSNKSYIELILPGLFDLLKLSKESQDNWEAERYQIIIEFLTKCDQTLLKAWGEKKFSENLAPLGVSLDKWLTVDVVTEGSRVNLIASSLVPMRQRGNPVWMRQRRA